VARQRIPDDVRAAVADEMRQRHAGKPTVREIATQFGISTRSVQTIATELGVHSESAHAVTKNANDQVRRSNAQRRADISALFAQRAEEALMAMRAPAVIFNFGGKDNTYNEKNVEQPPTADQRNLMTIAAIAMDKHKMLDAYDSASENTDVAAWLEWMSGAPKRG
jgi:phage repressor protein C with HTH and peptisase S24 domain